MKFVPLLFLAGVSFAPHGLGNTFTLTSEDFKDGGFIPHPYAYNGSGCGGKNISPQLEWKNIPAGTKSFGLTVFDPDAPTNHGWWHWVIWDIPAKMNELPQDFAHKNIIGVRESKNDYNESGYGGPCPPVGHAAHRYVFTLYALPHEMLSISPNASAKEVADTMQKNVLGKAPLWA